MADSEDTTKVEKGENVPTGKPKGRPKKVENRGAHFRVPDHLKKPKVAKVYVPTGKPRGRPPGPSSGRVVKKDTPKRGRGRPAKKTKGGLGKQRKKRQKPRRKKMKNLARPCSNNICDLL
eukprot:TRINITY_DN22225_c0_g1_i1.p1 TRINITY_DN22225_c0_g1~~TRINITY_DN22225_c0_g1_i1.p1  ORF type:complete len:120 (-),score=36.25 TRINITY_DN22225_c0_g1_i1:79-438(-)